jgi:hypothetical protein
VTLPKKGASQLSYNCNAFILDTDREEIDKGLACVPDKNQFQLLTVADALGHLFLFWAKIPDDRYPLSYTSHEVRLGPFRNGP